MESKMTRRELLSSSSVLLLLIPVGASIACSSSDSGTPNNATPDSGGTPSGCDGISSTSTVTNSHTHTVCVASKDLSSPPAAGATYTTSIDLGHSHTIQLTAAQLTTINGGGSVTVTSSAPAAHDFTIKKA